MSAPLVSILTPVYNRARFIGHCLSASLAQTFQDFEIVVVDNASTDGTWEICRYFAAQDSRIRLFRNSTNIGALPNWRRAFAEARGRLGKIVFSDDLIAPLCLELTVPALSPDVAFVVTPAEIGAQPGQGIVRYRWKPHSGIFPAEDYFAATLDRDSLPVSPVSSLYRLEDLRKNLCTDIASPGIRDFAVHGAGPDLLLSLLTARSYPQIAFVAEPLAFFRDHPGTLTRFVDGRLSDCYNQTRIWFGIERGDKSYSAAALAATWMRHMREQHRFIPPHDIKRRFLCDPSAMPTRRLLYGAAHILSRRLGHHWHSESM